MPTDQVTQLHPPALHYPSCDRDVYGAAVLDMLRRPEEGEITADRLRNWVRGYRETTSCECVALRVKSLEGQLERADKAFKASVTEDNADRVAFLKSELARLRGM